MKGTEYLEKKLKEREEKAKELWEEAIEQKEIIGLTKATKQFKVVLYPENTEFVACLLMLAQINEWFPVFPIKEKEV